MPGVRYQEVRSLITMAQVLDLLGFVAQEKSGAEVRGPCPVHGSTSRKSRSFTANLVKNAYRCFRCGSQPPGSLRRGYSPESLRGSD